MKNKIIDNDAEFEIAIIIGSIAILDEILSSEIFEIHGSGEDQNISFKNRVSQRYFYLSLIDFLSDIDSSFKLTTDKCSMLDGLLQISCAPKIGYKKHIKSLKKHSHHFKKWLEKKTTVNFWSPKIDTNAKLTLKRFDMVKICANMSKHGILRLGGIALNTQDIFQKNKIDIPYEKAILCLEDFYDTFYNNILIYHSSYIAEMLLNIRLSINEYLTPIYHRCLRNLDTHTGDEIDKLLKERNKTKETTILTHNERLTSNANWIVKMVEGRYEYIIPKEIRNDTIKAMFWDTMNSVRFALLGRRLRSIKATKYLKLRF